MRVVTMWMWFLLAGLSGAWFGAAKSRFNLGDKDVRGALPMIVCTVWFLVREGIHINRVLFLALGFCTGIVLHGIGSIFFGIERRIQRAAEQQDFDSAERLAQRYVRQHGGLDSHVALGHTYAVQEKWQDARDAFEQADAIGRGSAPNVADVFDDTEHLAPKGAVLRMNVAIARWKCGDPESALPLATSAATALPDEAFVQLQCAQIALAAGRPDVAQPWVERARPGVEETRHEQQRAVLREMLGRCDANLRGESEA